MQRNPNNQNSLDCKFTTTSTTTTLKITRGEAENFQYDNGPLNLNIGRLFVGGSTPAGREKPKEKKEPVFDKAESESSSPKSQEQQPLPVLVNPPTEANKPLHVKGHSVLFDLPPGSKVTCGSVSTDGKFTLIQHGR